VVTFAEEHENMAVGEAAIELLEKQIPMSRDDFKLIALCKYNAEYHERFEKK
jgi:hypothetical protein